MRFLNHHYTYNSDVTTCACLKRTPTTINITNHVPCQTNSPEINWGKTSLLSFSHKGYATLRAKANCHEKASPLAPRNSGSKRDPYIPKTTNLLIRKAPFQRLVRKLALKFGKSDQLMQSTAVLDLQEAAEYFMIDVFSNTNLCTMHGKQVTIKVKDRVLACCIQGIGMARA
jgi:histone H3/H4